MKQCLNRSAIIWCMLIGLAVSGAVAQSLTDKLKQEDNFYVNYGKDTYAKLKIEKDVVGLYDFFGEHIVDGVKLYELSYKNSILDAPKEGINDSVQYSTSLEQQKHDFYEKFSNLVITQDAIGGIKTSFLVGDQITTKFTPLTFNMVDFRGIRWDLWSSGLQFSLIMNRTRPEFLSKKTTDGQAMVEYPITENSFPGNYYTRNIRGDQDFTSKSPYGDYDFIWALHAQTNIANVMDVGLTYINHHVNDVKRGPQPFQGNLPDSLIPNAIHFEFYDATPEDTTDAGVFVDDVRMYINDQEVEARDVYRDKFRRAFTGDKDGVLVPRDIPMARCQYGQIPVIVEFQVNPKYWRWIKANPTDRDQSLFDISQVKKIKFSYKVAGNYMVYVSTDRQIPLAINGTPNPQTRRTDYLYPTKQVGDIYDLNLNIGASSASATSANPSTYSTTYFGQYIAQSSRNISMGVNDFNTAVDPNNKASMLYADKVKYNYRAYEWNYNLNVASVTYGLNFKGEIAGVKFAGEFALNQREDMLPGSNDSREDNYKIAATLKAEREFGRHLGVSAEAYYISPDWMTNLDPLQTSRYFNQTNYKEYTQPGGAWTPLYGGGDPDYLTKPRPLSNEWYNIDCNKDNDAFPENNRRHYPSDLSADDQVKFYDDGTLKPPVQSVDPNSFNKVLHTLELPNDMKIVYDDPDGVVASKTDKNKNGISDYLEDFLLFSSDPPSFELGQDLNNNGIPDYEDADILPDYGHQVGYVITGDGIKCLGVRGLNLNFRWSPIENTTVDLGGIMESENELEKLDPSVKVTEDWPMPKDNALEGKSYVAYLMAKQEVLKRSQGLQYDLGLELRYVRDALRNDAVRTNFKTYEQDYNVTYSYWQDRLMYRNSFVGNLVASLTYNNIRNFEYGIRGHVGGEKHMQINTNDGQPMLFYAPFLYDQKWVPFPNRTIVLADFSNRVQYKIGFNYEFDDWRNVFNFMNRLEIIPQFKFAFDARKQIKLPGDTIVERPQDIRKDILLDYDKNGDFDEILDNVGTNVDSADAVRSRFSEWSINNQMYTLSVPIVKLNYKIAENTQLQFGAQWAWYYNIELPENSLMKFTFLGQVVSKANYKGYNVTFFLGGRWFDYKYEVNSRDPVLFSGSRFENKGYEFFAKLYSGI